MRRDAGFRDGTAVHLPPRMGHLCPGCFPHPDDLPPIIAQQRLGKFNIQIIYEKTLEIDKGDILDKKVKFVKGA